jgi:hypothetical protein
VDGGDALKLIGKPTYIYQSRKGISKRQSLGNLNAWSLFLDAVEFGGLQIYTDTLLPISKRNHLQSYLIVKR